MILNISLIWSFDLFYVKVCVWLFFQIKLLCEYLVANFRLIFLLEWLLFMQICLRSLGIWRRKRIHLSRIQAAIFDYINLRFITLLFVNNTPIIVQNLLVRNFFINLLIIKSEHLFYRNLFFICRQSPFWAHLFLTLVINQLIGILLQKANQLNKFYASKWIASGSDVCMFFSDLEIFLWILIYHLNFVSVHFHFI